MLEGYFKLDPQSGPIVIEKHKRLLAVQAALEIAKASASSACAGSGGSMYNDLAHAKEQVEELADVIQAALDCDDTDEQ